MSALPKGWEQVCISDVGELRYGKGLPTNRLSKEGYPVFGANGIIGFHDHFMYEDEQLLISCRGANSGAINMSPKQCFVTNNSLVLELSAAGKGSRNFLKYALIAADRSKIVTGSAQPQVTVANASGFTLPFPPLPEQRRIVAKIDSLTGKSRRARDHLDHIPRLVEKYKQAILAAAFRGDLTREWREGRSLAATRSVLLGEVAEGFNYGSAAKSAKQGRVPVLRMGNIQDGKLDWADLVFTDDAAEIAKYRLKNGDVLFNRTNSPALVGKTALFTGKREAIYAGYLIKVRCKPQLLPAFLTYCLNAPNGRAYSWEVKTDGVSQSNINAKKLAAFRFDLPSVQEQEEIVRRIERALSWINRVTVDATSARKLIDYLDNSVLAKAFRGELVPQDPADEPASALLDRIREERAAAPKAKRGRKKAA